MVILKGTIQNGQVILPRPADFPDGTEVTVWPYSACKSLGIPDEQWPTDPEEIARLVARMDLVEPFAMTPAEEAELAGWRQKVKDYTLAHQDKAIDGLFE
jgi:hypothetical protein